MEMQRVSFDIPKEEHKYMKMACVKMGISLKDFITSSAIEKLEEYEDILMLEQIEKDSDNDKEYFTYIERDGTKNEIPC